ncbi:MAG: protein DA1 [candidate division Zixibacteria bacterium]|nr:protein DA1 [candidate division Zixibacteria bacterium]MDH3936218.1 protein DA1 [candidate division Zixibacteria bacterium]MDH4032997.1 protein DA1 [candidate division Zixibacteria bacterium]
MRKLSIVTVGLICLVVSASLFAARRVCDKCKQPITKGSWVEVDGKTYHGNHFLCDHCSKPIGKKRFYEHEGGNYDSTCFADHVIFRCGYCSKPVLTSYVGDDTALYHTTCFYDHVVERCMVCKNALTDSLYYDPFGNKVCSDDFERILRCQSCARFLKDAPGIEHLRYADGRTMCASCTETAVTDLDEAESIMKGVTRRLRGEGIDIKPEVTLQLVTLDELGLLSDHFTHDQMGITIFEKQTIEGGSWSHSDFQICILVGLPAYHFRVIVAHELMHVWMFNEGRPDPEDLLREGSCNYAAYLILRRDSSEKGQLLLERFVNDDHPVYGEGFRKVKTFVDKAGIEAWLEYLTTFTDPPW